MHTSKLDYVSGAEVHDAISLAIGSAGLSSASLWKCELHLLRIYSAMAAVPTVGGLFGGLLATAWVRLC